jgi:hypothetical protein
VTCHVLPTADGTEVSEIAWGLCSALQSDLDSAATNLQFKVVGGSANLLYESDDGSTDDDDNDSGVDAVADTWIICRIDCTDGDAAKFYVNGALVGTTVTTNLTASNDNVQPFFRYIKAKSSKNVSVGTLYIDYVRIWQDRE